jgi:hypothetical protein
MQYGMQPLSYDTMHVSPATVIAPKLTPFILLHFPQQEMRSEQIVVHQVQLNACQSCVATSIVTTRTHRRLQGWMTFEIGYTVLQIFAIWCIIFIAQLGGCERWQRSRKEFLYEAWAVHCVRRNLWTRSVFSLTSSQFEI